MPHKNNLELKQTIDSTIDNNKTIKSLVNSTIDNSTNIKSLTVITTENRKNIKNLTVTTSENSKNIKKLMVITSKNSKSIDELKEGQLRFGVLQEEMDTKLDTLIEIIAGPIKKTEQIPALNNQLKDHEFRIRSIERTLIPEK